MKTISFRQIQLNIFIPVYLFALFITSTQAQEVANKKHFLYDITSQWRIEGAGLLGVGIKNHEVGKTTEDEKISISGGGGYGGTLILGYGFSPQFDVSIGAGIQNSTLIPKVKNADGSFLRTMFLATLKYKKPITSRGLLNIGAGLDFFSPGDLDINASKVAEGGHNIYSYKESTGFHLLAEYEGFINNKLSWIIGLKYYYVTYKLKSANLDGLSVPSSVLPDELKKEVANLNGSGVDMIMSLNMYF